MKLAGTDPESTPFWNDASFQGGETKLFLFNLGDLKFLFKNQENEFILKYFLHFVYYNQTRGHFHITCFQMQLRSLALPTLVSRKQRSISKAGNILQKMAAFSHTYFSKDLLSSLSTEVLDMILSYLPAKSLLNVSECNRRLFDLCRNCNFLWKHLCKVRHSALHEIMHAMFISSLQEKYLI